MTVAATFAVLDLIGTFLFALTGALVAHRRRMDLVGMFVLALVTAAGGGTLRALLTGDLPVPLLRSPWPVGLSALATLIVQFAAAPLARVSHPVQLFDAIGLGVFVATGTMAALDVGSPGWAAVLLGCITATCGGVLRDVLRNAVPLIFRPGEFYAIAAALGGVALLLVLQAGGGRSAAMIVGAAVTILVRLASVYLHWTTRAPRAGGT